MTTKTINIECTQAFSTSINRDMNIKNPQSNKNQQQFLIKMGISFLGSTINEIFSKLNLFQMLLQLNSVLVREFNNIVEIHYKYSSVYREPLSLILILRIKSSPIWVIFIFKIQKFEILVTF